MFYEGDEVLVQVALDLFDCELRQKLDLSQLYLIFLLVCSVESGQLLQFQHQFGRSMFELLGNRTSQVPLAK